MVLLKDDRKKYSSSCEIYLINRTELRFVCFVLFNLAVKVSHTWIIASLMRTLNHLSDTIILIIAFLHINVNTLISS